MDRIAVFVDAGYLFAQGSTCLSGKKTARTSIVLNAPAAISEFKQMVVQRSPDCRLLRIYWYDGTLAGARPTTDQATLANLDDVKLRLGFVNSHGQQKGVDSLIVTDLIELARLKSISDAILMSGDEDVRIGVQIAQNYGVRVHLLGIQPIRGSQSAQLMQEADTTTEWTREIVSKFLAVRPGLDAEPIQERTVEPPTRSIAQAATLPDDDLTQAVALFVLSLGEAELTGIIKYWETDRGVPPDLDRKLLPLCGTALGRKLERDEIKAMRAKFQSEVKKRIK